MARDCAYFASRTSVASDSVNEGKAVINKNNLKLFWIGLVMTVGASFAANAMEGTLNAVSLQPVSAIKVVSVQTYDDSEENLILKAELIKELTARGYEVSDGADLILNFETRDQMGAWDPGSQSHVIELEASGGRGGGENHKARVNVFDSSEGGLLNRDQGRRGASLQASQYRIDVTLEARSNGKTYWRAWSVAELTSGEGLTLIKKMIPALVQNLGKTVRSQKVPIE